MTSRTWDIHELGIFYDNTLTSVKTKEAVLVISEYCLLIFKACRIGHPNFEIKFIGLFFWGELIDKYKDINANS